MAVASAAIATADSAVTVVASVAIAARAARAMTPKPAAKGSKNHGRSWCTPYVFPPPQDLSVHRSECAEDRLQGFQAVDALRLRARQDRAEPHHGGFRQEAARTRARHQALAFPRSASLRHSLNDTQSAAQMPRIELLIRLPGRPVADGWGRQRPLTAR